MADDALGPGDAGGGAAVAVRVGAGEATTAMRLSLFRQPPLEQSVLVNPRAVQVRLETVAGAVAVTLRMSAWPR